MEKREPDLKKGEIFAGYRITEKLGPGVMGTVYLARDTATVRRVALKVLQPELVSDSEYVQFFEEQASAAIEADHRNVARFYTAGNHEGCLYTACEFVPGDTLAALIERQGRIDPQIAISLLLTIGKALAYLHSLGIVHGGVNPGNIRLTRMGEIKLVDAGLAKKLLLRPEKPDRKSTVTPVYLAPELVSRPTRIDQRADIYSLGITAYEALTGKMPFMSDSPHETVLRIMNEPLLVKDMPGIPPEIAAMIEKMTAKNPADRHPSMLEAVAELESLAAKFTPSAVGAGPTESARHAMYRRSTRERRKLLAYALIAVIVVAGFLAFYLPGGREEGTTGSQTITPAQRAEKALEEARNFEAQHPDSLEEILELYRSIAGAYSGTDAASKAREEQRRVLLGLTVRNVSELVKQDRLYDAAMACDAFERHHPGSDESSEAARRKSELLRIIEDRFHSDMLQASIQEQKGETQPAIERLKQVEVYGSPEHREGARQKIDEMQRRAGASRLQGAHTAAWETAEPMLAIVMDHIARREYQEAEKACDSFLSGPLPEGIRQIISWERKDIARLRKVQENFEAALGDAANRGSRTSFTLADGATIAGTVSTQPDGYYLELSKDRKWRIRSADLLASVVLKLAGMEVRETEAMLTTALYELYYGIRENASRLVAELSSELDEESLTRYRHKVQLVSALIAKRAARTQTTLDPRELKRAAGIVESARMLMEQKEWNQSYQLLRQAVEINPAEPDTWRLLAVSADRKGLSNEAAGYYRKALAFNPGNPILWNALGKVYLAQNELGLALAAFSQASRINPADPVAARHRIEVLKRLGREEEARRAEQEWETIRQR